jgi:hypothetical protein
MFDVVKAKPKLILHIVGQTTLLFHPMYVGAGFPCLQVLTLVLHKVLVLASISQHLLSELGDNLAMCHYEARHSISNVGMSHNMICIIQ